MQAYFPPSLEVLELRVPVGKFGPHNDDLTIRTLLKLSSECAELPRLRKITIMQLFRGVVDVRGRVGLASEMIDYRQIESQFKANGVDLKLRGGRIIVD